MPQTSGRTPQCNAAILIDGDNAQASQFERILLEVARYGRPTIRRIYGDWTAANMGSWRAILHDHAIQPVQQFRNTVGKNATDSALIIDAMDILNSRTIGCFCIVSSDSDYTRLATRIREDGVQVIGIGRKMTPQAFVKACDVFIITENLEVLEDLEDLDEIPARAEPGAAKPEKARVAAPQPAAAAPKPEVKKVATPKTKTAAQKKMSPPLDMLKKAFEMTVQEDGWANLSSIGEALRRRDPAFDSRTWGYSQLSQLMKAAGSTFEMKRSTGPGAGGMFVKLKSPAKTKAPKTKAAVKAAKVP